MLDEVVDEHDPAREGVWQPFECAFRTEGEVEVPPKETPGGSIDGSMQWQQRFCYKPMFFPVAVMTCDSQLF